MIAAIALDHNELRSSNRILLLHVTDVQEEGAKYSGRDMRVILENADTRQLLARKGVAEISVRTPPGNWKLFALNFSGRRIGEVPFRTTADGIGFTADTFFGKEVVFAYELTR